MFLKSKEIAYTGILMAFAVLLLILGGYLEGSTLFLLAAASFLVGIVQMNFSVVTAVLFLVGTLFLGLILAPQKLYCATFAAFSVYIILEEFLLKKEQKQQQKILPGILWGSKAFVYHILLAFSLFLTERLLGFGDFLQLKWVVALKQYRILFVIILILLAECVWLIFDRAYLYFRRHYGHYFRIREG